MNFKESTKKIIILIFCLTFIAIVIYCIFLIVSDVNKKAIINETKSIDETIPIPEGFYFVGGTKDTGFIISDDKDDYKKGSSYEQSKKLKGNQFVWVPVENPVAESIDKLDEMYFIDEYPMAVKTGDNYSSVFYYYDNTTKKCMKLSQNSKICEPCILSDNIYGDTEEILTGSTTNMYQTNFNKMVKSVEKYKGFYVSRYEVGNLSKAITNGEKVVSKSGQTDIFGISWFEMYKSISKMYEREDITTEMIWGCQWDSIIRWIYFDNNLQKYIFDSYDKGNYYNSDVTTGANAGYSLKNIYDLAGNVCEWTQEGIQDSSRAIKGGSYQNKFMLSTMYKDVSPSYFLEDLGSRITMYIN